MLQKLYAEGVVQIAPPQEIVRIPATANHWSQDTHDDIPVAKEAHRQLVFIELFARVQDRLH